VKPLELVNEPATSSAIARQLYLARTLKRAQLIDRMGGLAIKLAGILVLASVALILFFLLSQATPLFLEPAKHPSGSLAKLFLPQQYEGYSRPIYFWQTEGDGDPKFGIPLLIYGTFKASLWAMLFSVPLALLSAMFVAEFCGPKTRVSIKSCVEILAGIPTVVIGFVAFVTFSTWMGSYYQSNEAYFREGYWFAFFLQALVFSIGGSVLAGWVILRNGSKPAKFLGLLGALLLALLAAWLLGKLLLTLTGIKIFIFVVLAVMAGLLIFNSTLSAPMRIMLFFCALLISAAAAGVLAQSVLHVFAVERFTKLNAVLTGFALSFAVIPIIFSVAEDAMKAVPHSFREASFALGASKWETALQVVAPSAAPGIYAALMLGLARAVGETMIVLMASGSTAIFDLSPFTGMRTMSAAIAIEAPEKELFSTGYYVLFLIGALLFLITFVLNAATTSIIARLKRGHQAGP
jgi:phosphate transport system permease protein